MSKYEEYAALRQSGMTYREIAEIYGCSRQNIAQRLTRKTSSYKGYGETRCVYAGLRNWLNENSVCVSELLRRMYGENPASGDVSRCSRLLKGELSLRKPEIDAIIAVTGLTYEELFCSA